MTESARGRANHEPDRAQPPAWMFEEAGHAGVDYADPAVAERYDEQHGRFRDFERDALLIVERLGLRPEHRVIDMGSGTGAFALTAAPRCRHVDAVDISAVMLERLRAKAAARHLANIQTHCAGFLTYQHLGEPADAVVSVAALHHLPDFWKGVAIRRLHAMLKPGGRFYLFDVVFSFEPASAGHELDAWIESLRQHGGDSMAAEAVVHVRDEHSTFDWIMDGWSAGVLRS
jgi:cyclopropane fatty-acyl-phospholipid synthase-like methyltransferase